MTATSVKNEAKRLIENLPDTASWDDLMYEVYGRQKIDDGIKAADEGRVLTHEEVRKRFAMQCRAPIYSFSRRTS
jgi:predicted transcriptional regulator